MFKQVPPRPLYGILDIWRRGRGQDLKFSTCYNTFNFSVASVKFSVFRLDKTVTHTWFNCSRCSFSMMVKLANDGLHQANDGECSSMMVKWVYHTRISPSLTSISPSLTCILPSLAWGKPSFAHLTIIEKLHRLNCCNHFKLLSPYYPKLKDASPWFPWNLGRNVAIDKLII